jgi:hypothetical protein
VIPIASGRACAELPHTTLSPHTTENPLVVLSPHTTLEPIPRELPLTHTDEPHTTLEPQNGREGRRVGAV